jgi:hypothetical protein
VTTARCCPWRALSLALLVAGCAADPHVPTDGLVRLGTWGGRGAGVIATELQTHVHVGCTSGDIPGRLAVDPDGRFSLGGEYDPVVHPVAGAGIAMPATFSGRLRGRELTITVVVQDTVRHEVVTLGPVTVEFGRDPDLGPCPICLVPGAPARR